MKSLIVPASTSSWCITISVTRTRLAEDRGHAFSPGQHGLEDSQGGRARRNLSKGYQPGASLHLDRRAQLLLLLKHAHPVGDLRPGPVERRGQASPPQTRGRSGDPGAAALRSEATKQSIQTPSFRDGALVSTRPQMRNCASGNLEILGSMLRIAPE